MNEYKNAYKWSKDYKRLKYLLDNGYMVVCLADYDFYKDGSPKIRDICKGTFVACEDNHEHDCYRISARGIGYVDYYGWESDFRTFDETCERMNIEFIDIEI